MKKNIYFLIVLFSLISIGAFAQPSNDDCENATVVTLDSNLDCNLVTAGTNLDATASSQADDVLGTPNDDVWFSFVAEEEAYFISLLDIVVLNGGSFPDMALGLYDATNGCNALTLTAESDPDSFLAENLTPGTSYLLRVYGWGEAFSTMANFNVCITTLPPPPVNDNCENAIALSVESDLACSMITPGTTVAATASPQADDVVGIPDNDVWYSFVATATAHRIALENLVRVFGFGTNLAMGLYDATDGCDMLIFSQDSDPESFIANNLTVGGAYLLRVYGPGTGPSKGNVTFDVCVGTLPPPPTNDECENAISLPVNPTLDCTEVVSADNVGATASPQADDVNGTPNNDVWFNFTATSDRHVVSLSNVSIVIGFNDALGIGVYDVSSGCDMLELKGTNAFLNELEVENLTPGNDYVVRIYGWEEGETFNARVTFDICISTFSSAPANDVCATATQLSSGDTDMLNTISASLDSVNCMSIEETKGVWYTFNDGGVPSIATISLCDSDFSTYMALYTGDCDNLFCVTTIFSDFSNCGDAQSYLNFITDGSSDYYVLAGTAFTTGNLVIELDLIPALDASVLCDISMDQEIPDLSCSGDTTILGGGAGNTEPIVYEYPTPIISDDCSSRISQNLVEDTEDIFGLDCIAEDPSGHARVFDLAAAGIENSFVVSQVEIGINNSAVEQMITINLYTEEDLGNPIFNFPMPLSDVTAPLATTDYMLPVGENFFVTVPISAVVPPNSKLIVEVITPVESSFLIGYDWPGFDNVARQSTPGYFSCPASDISVNYQFPSNDEFSLLISASGYDLQLTQTAGLASGAEFPIGETINTFTLEDAAGNVESCSFTVTVETPVSNNDLELSSNISISPNPATDVVNIIAQSGSGMEEISIIDINGRMIMSNQLPGETQTYSFDLSSFTSGIYFVKITSGENSTVKKIIKE